MENWQIGRADGELKLSDLKTEKLVELLREIIAHHKIQCGSYYNDFCPVTDRAESFLLAYDEFKSKL